MNLGLLAGFGGDICAAPDLAQTKQHEAALRAAGHNLNPYVALSPKTVVDAIETELQSALAAPLMPEALATKAAIYLVKSYPQADASIATPYLASMTAEMSAFPADIVSEAMRDLLRTCSFRPSVSEFRSSARAIMAERGGLLLLAKRQSREHRRRAEEQRKQELRERECLERHGQVEAELRSKFPGCFPAWFSMAVAWRGITTFLTVVDMINIEKAALEGDDMAALRLRRGALLGHALAMVDPMLGQGRMAAHDVAVVAKCLAEGADVEAARLVETALVRTGTAGEANTPTPVRAEVMSDAKAALSLDACQRKHDAEGSPDSSGSRQRGADLSPSFRAVNVPEPLAGPKIDPVGRL